MNIFEVLSQGKSRLHEPSISAMLGYLLDPSSDHGLGDTFLRSFIKFLISETTNNAILINLLNEQNRINAIVELEVQYSNLSKRNDIDIQLSLLDSSENEFYRIIIENKIRPSSANSLQLRDNYAAIINDEDFQLQKPNLTIVFLTPAGPASGLEQEFNNLNDLQQDHDKVWVTWTDKENSNSVLELIKDVLRKEMLGEINPINEYMRHTLKAFTKFIGDKTSNNVSEKKMRTGQDIGNITDEVVIELNSRVKYKIIRRDSSQIQVFNEDTGDKEIARHIMAKYIDENGIVIEHSRYNTRTIGKKLLNHLEER